MQIVGGLLLAAAIIAALGVIGKGLVWLYGVMRKLNQLLDDLAGEPPRPGFPDGRPGLFARLESIEGKQADVVARLAAVEAQLAPNGGGSLRDAVDRVVEQTQPAA